MKEAAADRAGKVVKNLKDYIQHRAKKRKAKSGKKYQPKNTIFLWRI